MTAPKASPWTIAGVLVAFFGLLVIPVGAWVQLSSRLSSIETTLIHYNLTTQASIERVHGLETTASNLRVELAALAGRVTALEIENH